MIRKKEVANRQQIISEYLTGEQTFEALSERYGVNGRTIQSWVRSFRMLNPVSDDLLVIEDEKSSKVLKKQLEHALIKIELLEAMLHIAKEQTGIDFKKKVGAKQS